MDLTNEWTNPELSLRPDAHLVHDGAYAEPGNVPTWTCLFPKCEIKLNNEEALDQHAKTHSFTAAAPYIDIDRLTLAAEDFHHRHDPSPTTGALTDNTNVTLPSPSPDGPTACAHPGCNRTFTRAADLERHVKKHQDGPKEYHCWEQGCRRNGVNGFYRRDKLVAHQKRHRE